MPDDPVRDLYRKTDPTVPAHRIRFLIPLLVLFVVPADHLPGQGIRSGWTTFKEWGIRSLKEVRYGEFTISSTDTGDCLSISSIRPTLPKRWEPPPETYPPWDSVGLRPRLRQPVIGLWVWNTQELLSQEPALKDLLRFVEQEHIGRIFLQLPDTARQETNNLRALVRELHSAHAEVFALDGWAGYALKENHAEAVSILDRVIRHNKLPNPAECFDGIQFDVEPYLLPGFQGDRKLSILAQYVELCAALSSRARSAGIRFSVAVPFWFDTQFDESGNEETIDVGGVSKPVYQHVIDRVDELCIMSYRTNALGPGGIVDQVTKELRYAMKAGKAVFASVETTILPNERTIRFRDAPFRPAYLDTSMQYWIVLRDSAEGFSCFIVAREHFAAVWGSIPADAYCWQTDYHIEVPASRLSFANGDPEKFRDEVRKVIEALKPAREFFGVVIHDYLGFRKLVGR